MNDNETQYTTAVEVNCEVDCNKEVSCEQDRNKSVQIRSEVTGTASNRASVVPRASIIGEDRSEGGKSEKVLIINNRVHKDDATKTVGHLGNSTGLMITVFNMHVVYWTEIV